MKRKYPSLLLAIALFLSLLCGCQTAEQQPPAPSSSPAVTLSPAGNPSTAISSGPSSSPAQTAAAAAFDLSQVPAYSKDAYVAVNGNQPYFTPAELTTTSFEDYSSLDALGRCGVATACVGKDLMPTEERGQIGSVKPTGWHTVRYDDLVDGKYLYNRCHLIGYQLSGENANDRNLITGTRYLNVEGMLPFENMVADYVKETNNHVLYRVTPIFDGDDLLAKGVLMEGYSVEDDGDGVCFCVFAYNVQPYIDIDYATGESELSADAPAQPTPSAKPTSTPKPTATPEPVSTPAPTAAPTSPPTPTPKLEVSGATYIGNRNSRKFHEPNCPSVDRMNESNKVFFYGDRGEPISAGYDPCGNCNP